MRDRARAAALNAEAKRREVAVEEELLRGELAAARWELQLWLFQLQQQFGSRSNLVLELTAYRKLLGVMPGVEGSEKHR